jgi:branched-chain amino acid transport system ATP-binding protein
VLEVEDVHTYYGTSHVLQGISLTMSSGEVLTILGRNGVGKTTLVRSIIGFTPPRRGRVCFKGDDITRWPPPGSRARDGSGSPGAPHLPLSLRP